MKSWKRIVAVLGSVCMIMAGSGVSSLTVVAADTGGGTFSKLERMLITARLEDENEALRAENETLKAENEALKKEIEALKAEIETLKASDETEPEEAEAQKEAETADETLKMDVKDGKEGVIEDRETIKLVQAALNKAGFDCGDQDGVAGTKTENAIRKYQGKNGLTVDGKITYELLEALGIE